MLIFNSYVSLPEGMRESRSQENRCQGISGERGVNGKRLQKHLKHLCQETAMTSKKISGEQVTSEKGSSVPRDHAVAVTAGQLSERSDVVPTGCSPFSRHWLPWHPRHVRGEIDVRRVWCNQMQFSPPPVNRHVLYRWILHWLNTDWNEMDQIS